jgi:hypothetical protein
VASRKARPPPRQRWTSSGKIPMGGGEKGGSRHARHAGKSCPKTKVDMTAVFGCPHESGGTPFQGSARGGKASGPMRCASARSPNLRPRLAPCSTDADCAPKTICCPKTTAAPHARNEGTSVEVPSVLEWAIGRTA